MQPRGDGCRGRPPLRNGEVATSRCSPTCAATSGFSPRCLSESGRSEPLQGLAANHSISSVKTLSFKIKAPPRQRTRQFLAQLFEMFTVRISYSVSAPFMSGCRGGVAKYKVTTVDIRRPGFPGICKPPLVPPVTSAAAPLFTQPHPCPQGNLSVGMGLAATSRTVSGERAHGAPAAAALGSDTWHRGQALCAKKTCVSLATRGW